MTTTHTTQADESLARTLSRVTRVDAASLLLRFWWIVPVLWLLATLWIGRSLVTHR